MEELGISIPKILIIACKKHHISLYAQERRSGLQIKEEENSKRAPQQNLF